MENTNYRQEEDETNNLCEPDIDYPGLYSYADYLKWTIEERLELIKGKIFKMSPAPNRYHQEISFNLAGPIWHYFKDKSCKVFTAPFDVRFPTSTKNDKDVYTVLQPDLCIVCDLSKLDKAGCIGAPDVVVEILSPSNNKKDLKNKYEIYEEHGVKEYWVVSPQDKTFLAYILNAERKYVPTRLMVEGDVYETNLWPGLEIDMEEIFGSLDTAD